MLIVAVDAFGDNSFFYFEDVTWLSWGNVLDGIGQNFDSYIDIFKW